MSVFALKIFLSLYFCDLIRGEAYFGDRNTIKLLYLMNYYIVVITTVEVFFNQLFSFDGTLLVFAVD